MQTCFGGQNSPVQSAWRSNPNHAAHHASCKRRALRATLVYAAVQTKLDVDQYVQQSKSKRLELLEVSQNSVNTNSQNTNEPISDMSHACQPSSTAPVLCMQRQALETLRTAVEGCEQPVFPCSLIAGDLVILDLLAKLDYLKTGRVAVAFIDTFHLFPETITFLKQLEVCHLHALLHMCWLKKGNITPGTARCHCFGCYCPVASTTLVACLLQPHTLGTG